MILLNNFMRRELWAGVARDAYGAAADKT
jgi:hypothetical protein